MCHRYAIIFTLDRIKWLEFLVLSLRICALTALGAGKLGFSFVRITALLLTKDRMWVGTGNGVILSIPLVVAQPESSKSAVTSPVDSGGPGGVVRVYTDTEGKGEQTGSSRFMPYCSMVSV